MKKIYLIAKATSMKWRISKRMRNAKSRLFLGVGNQNPSQDYRGHIQSAGAMGNIG